MPHLFLTIMSQFWEVFLRNMTQNLGGFFRNMTQDFHDLDPSPEAVRSHVHVEGQEERTWLIGSTACLEVLQRVHNGESRSGIERATGRSRKTIGRYVKAAKALGWLPERDKPDEALASRVIERHQPGPKDVMAGKVEQALRAHHARIEAWLGVESGKRGLPLTKVHQLLSHDGVEDSYSSSHRYAVEGCAVAGTGNGLTVWLLRHSQRKRGDNR